MRVTSTGSSGGSIVERTLAQTSLPTYPHGVVHAGYRTASASLRSVVTDSRAQASCARAACSPALMVIKR